MHLTKSPDQELGQKIQICGLDGLNWSLPKHSLISNPLPLEFKKYGVVFKGSEFSPNQLSTS